MNTLYLIILLFLLHLVADFIFQPRWIANTKSYNIESLLWHVLIYTTTMCIFLIAVGYISKYSITSVIPMFVIGVALSHLMVDFVSSKMTKKFHLDGKQYAFFTTIGLDQFLHEASLLIIVQHCFNIFNVR